MYLLRSFFRFLASKAFVLFVLVTALSLFIWFAGPLFAFANHRPLELASVRWRVIVFLFLCYLLWLLCRIWIQLRLGGRLINRMSRVKGSLEKQRRTHEVSAAQRMLQERFNQALKTMKTMHRPAKLRRLLWGRRSAYDLPWYVVMGAPGAGKTSA